LRPSLPTLPLEWKLAALVVIVVVFSGVVAGYFASQTLTLEINGIIGDRLLGVARMIADRGEVRRAFKLQHPEDQLQPLTEMWMSQSGVDLIVIFDMNGVRYAHPNPELIGQLFTGGDEAQALQGQEYISQAVGISGPSLRAFVPVYDDDHKQVGVVVVGMWMWHLGNEVRDILVDAGVVSLVGLVVGILGAGLVAYNIKASIFGLEPAQIRALLEERMAIIQSIREGVIAVDKNSRVALVNKEAERLTGIDQDAVGQPVGKVLPNTLLPEVVATGRHDYDQEQVLMGRVILTNRVPIVVEGKVVGAVATFRDLSEIRELASELTGVKQLAETLRAQAHEFVNRLHTVSGLIQLNRHEDALEYISTVTRNHEEIVDFVTRRIHDPALAGLMLGKISVANERGISLTVDPDSYVPVRDSRLSRVDLVTVVGNLIENAFDAASPVPEESRNVWVSLYCSEKEMLIEVEDTGVGIEDSSRPRLFERGYTTKAGSKGIGLSLVMTEVNRVGGNIQVESKPGTGTRFTIHLPRAGSQERV
jgi:PAS domain S-box-containing protein